MPSSATAPFHAKSPSVPNIDSRGAAAKEPARAAACAQAATGVPRPTASVAAATTTVATVTTIQPATAQKARRSPGGFAAAAGKWTANH